METQRFDELARSLAGFQSSRRSMLQRFGGGGVAALLATLGIAVVPGEVDAKKKKNVCSCANANDQCQTQRLSKKARKQELRDRPCSYKGECRGTGTQNPCDGAGVDIDIDIDLLGIICTAIGNECGNANETGLECSLLGLICLPVDCPEVRVCVSESENNAQCCVVDAECIAGVCLLPLD